MTTLYRCAWKKCGRPLSQRVIRNALARGIEPRFHSKRCRSAWHAQAARDRKKRAARTWEPQVIDAGIARKIRNMSQAQLDLHRCSICRVLDLLHDDEELGHPWAAGPVG